MTLLQKPPNDCRKSFAEINDLLKTSASFVEALNFLAHREMTPKLSKLTEELKQRTGTVLRIDHTYKAVKNIAAYSKDDEARVCSIYFKL
jgi:hypothetical protein